MARLQITPADRERFAALPARDQALLLCRLNQAHEAAQHYKERGHYFGQRGNALDLLVAQSLAPHGFDLGNQISDIMLLAPPGIPEQEIKWGRLVRLRDALHTAAGQLQETYNATPREPAPLRVGLGAASALNKALGKDPWKINEKQVPEGKVRAIIGTMASYLRALPLNERYDILRWSFHRAGNGYPEPFRRHEVKTSADGVFIRNLVRHLLVDSPQEGLAVERDMAKVQAHMSGHSAYAPKTPRPGNDRGRQ